MGIHYDYKSTKSAKLMERQAKREKKLAEKKAKRLAKEGPKSDDRKINTLVPRTLVCSTYHVVSDQILVFYQTTNRQ